MRCLLVAILILSATSFSHAADTAKEIELTTYYPAPYGDYSILKTTDFILNPTSTPSPAARGQIYYKAGDNKIYYNTDGTAAGWAQIGNPQQKSSFSASNSTDQDIPEDASDFVKIEFDSESFDENNSFSLHDATSPDSTSRHTPKVAGKYVYIISFAYDADTTGPANELDDIRIGLFKKGIMVDESIKRYGRIEHYGGDKIRLSSHPISMNGTTDYVEAFALHDREGAPTINLTISEQQFSGYRVSD